MKYHVEIGKTRQTELLTIEQIQSKLHSGEVTLASSCMGEQGGWQKVRDILPPAILAAVDDLQPAASPAQAPTAPAVQRQPDSALSRASAVLGICGDVFFFIPLMIVGLPRALEYPSPVMGIGILLALIGLLLGLIAIFLKGGKRFAKVGIVTGGLVLLVILLPSL